MSTDAALRRALALPDDFSPELLTELKTRALGFVSQQTHRYFGPEVSREEVLTGTGTRRLMLPEQSVGGSVSVIEQEYPGAASTTLVEDTDFVARDHGTTTFLDRMGGKVWTFGWEYLVTVTVGYANEAWPADIEALIIALIGDRVTRIGSDGIQSESIGGYQYSRAAIHAFEDGDLRAIPGAMRTIAAWRHPVLA